MKQQTIRLNNIKVYYRTLVKKKGQGLKGFLKTRRTNFCALDDVSLDIIPGEILGIIGKNGSGKSTLLKVLGGIMKPDEGTLETENVRVSLLALSSSILTDLSGRDNIYLIGLQLGFSYADIDKQFDNIVEFAELEKFIDHPVRTYSSGMRSKLSFSIAVHLTTELMLIDELLSVGDMAFRQKSYAKIKELITDDNHTVVIVSHDMGRLRNLCDRVVWLDSGKIRMIGNPKTVIRAYQQEYTKTEKKLLVSDVQTPDLLEVRNTKDGLCVIWGCVLDATGYVIYRKQEDTGYKRIGLVIGAQTDTYEDTTVAAGQTYQYTVRAFRVYNGITDRSSVIAEGISGTALPQQADN